MAINEQTKEMKNFGIIKTIIASIKIMLQACGKKEILLFSVGLLTAVIPSLVLHIQKEFFAKAEEVASTPTETILSGVVWLLVAWGVLQIIHWVIGLFSSHAQRLIGARVNIFMMDSLLEKISAIRYEHMDTPEVYNKLEWISNELPNRIAQVVYGTMGLFYSVISLTSLGVLVMAEDPKIAWVVVIGGIPACIFMLMQTDEEYWRAQWEAPELRQQWHVYNLFVKRDSIREMRIGQYSEYLIKKWEDLSLKLRNHRYRHIRKYYILNLFSNVFSYGSIGVALWMICIQILDPTSNVGVGSFVLVYGVAAGLQGTVTSLFSEIMSMAATGKYLKDYEDLTSYSEEQQAGENDPLPKAADIKFENVSFSYPNTDRLVLQDINVEIKQGEKIAIVGENGSGKTTFFLLLCGLYQPQTGTISFAGKELMSCLGLMRRSTSFVFQDFGRYQLTVADNIRIGNMYKELTRAEIEAAAKSSGADEFIQKLDQEYDTFLGTLEEGHTDFSGGQWQKLAFARSITKRDARVMILDEQTAALDPISEAKFYHDFRDLTGDRTAIMISHRLGATKLADRILVFHEGKIVEEGSHEELMRRGGLYTEMYQAQAQWYVS